MRRLFSLGICFVIVAIVGCHKSKSTDLPHQDAQKIWSGKTYAAFTDIVKYHNEWYCVFREGKSHVSEDGALRILKSTDSNQWTEDTVLKVQGKDLRDPKFLIGLDGELMIYAAMRDSVIKNLIWKYNDNAGAWGSYLSSGVSADWMWRIRQYKQRFYSIAYG